MTGLALPLPRVSHATPSERILVVLDAFRANGATPAELTREYHRLSTDVAYYNAWAGDGIEDWHPDWAAEVFRYRYLEPRIEVE